MANTIDLLTLDEAHDVIGATNDNTYDATLERAITAITGLIETKVGPVVNRTITDEKHHGGGYTIHPLYQPVSSISSVVEAHWTSTVTLTAETFGTAPSDGYLWDPITGQIWRRQGGLPWMFWPGTLNVKITYVAGRAANTAAVSERFKEAAAVTLQHNWGLSNGAGNQTFGQFDGVDGQFGRGFALPNRALELLADDRKVPGIA